MSDNYDYDICLLLEGSYPFVSGGVSTWVHDLIKALPEIRFTAVSILPAPDEKWQPKYQLPDNFKDLKVVYLHHSEIEEESSPHILKRKKQIKLLKEFHKNLFNKKDSKIDKIMPIFTNEKRSGFTLHDLVYGKDSWKLLLDIYNVEENLDSFIDYFWTFRFTHLPMFNILKTEIPKAKVYHTISTGYAGLLGVVAKYLYNRPLLLTEHGIYTKERKIEISISEWIYSKEKERIKVENQLGKFHQMWINLFHSIGRIVYEKSDQIITLYEGNRKQEIKDGADPEKILIIPNGIDIEKFSKLKPNDVISTRVKEASLKIGFVGRVVPIKDVKTFIRACKIVSLKVKNVKFYIMGPYDEDLDYYQECLELVTLLELEDYIVFTGKINVLDYYPILDLIVLTSVSEAQPLVILEASCAGIPTVSGDVGSCRELLEGRTINDTKIGPSGIITKVADPSSTAEGIIRLLNDDNLMQQMSSNGRQRVFKYYNANALNENYLALYKKFLKQS